MKYKVRTRNQGTIGGFTATISVDGGESWVRVNRYVGGGLVSFDNKAQAMKEADKLARRLLRRAMEADRITGEKATGVIVTNGIDGDAF